MIMLSKHFSVGAGSITEHRDIDNRIPPELIANALVCAEGWERVRFVCGNRAIFWTSMYRCDQLNELVGGSQNSDHRWAAAGDAHHEMMSVTEFFERIYKNRDHVKYRQLIWEFGRWVHVAFDVGDDRQKPIPLERRELVIRTKAQGYIRYTEGMVI